jgi:hypothetical protein
MVVFCVGSLVACNQLATSIQPQRWVRYCGGVCCVVLRTELDSGTDATRSLKCEKGSEIRLSTRLGVDR